MGTFMADEAGENEALLDRAAGGEAAALAEFWERHRKRLRQMVRLRLDRRLQGRVDPSDVLQEAYIDLAERLPEYARDRAFTPYLWLRLVTGQRLVEVHRRHLVCRCGQPGKARISLCRRTLKTDEPGGCEALLETRTVRGRRGAPCTGDAR
jgi:hypothetical protein